ncbi:MAG: NADPH-dependent glutamate synthase [Mucinivorans sp.]
MREPRVAPREQEPAIRATNFDEVCYGYTLTQATREASRCLNCKNPRCVAACPVGVQIPQFIAKIVGGDIAAAAEVIARDNLLPSVCGRVCPQETQCEGSCVLGIKGQAVAIGALERFVGDEKIKNASINPSQPLTPGKGAKVAVVGSGPAGLAAAADLAKMGYCVTIFEALHKAGGVLQYGIPEFRLPKDKIVSREIDAVRALGVEIVTDTVVGRTVTIDDLMDKEGFKAVFVGSGAGLPKFMGIDGESLNGVVSANEFLTRNNLMKAYLEDYDTPIFTGNHTVVVGGGNVAMDAVRTAKRLGAKATIVYRRSQAELPARQEEVFHAQQEGIVFEMLTNPLAILGDEHGAVRAILCQRMVLGEPDSSGRRSPRAVEGSDFTIECSSVVMALGTSPNPLIAQTTPGLQITSPGCLVASADGATTRAGVFAGGDVVSGAATVILAMGAGRRAARAIDQYLSKE